MHTSISLRWLVVAVSAAMLLAFAAACGATETIEVPGETVVVEKEVIKEVIKEVPVEKIVEVEKVVREVVVATPGPADERFYMSALDPGAKRGGVARLHQHGPPASFDVLSSTSNSRQNWMSLLWD